MNMIINPFISFGGSTMVIEPNARMYDGILTTSGTQLTYGMRMPYYIGADAIDLTMALTNWYMNVSGLTALETTITNDWTIVGMSIEAPNGNVKQIFFNGSLNRTVTAAEPLILSDKITPLTGYSKFTRGEKYWVKMIIEVATTGHSFPRNVSSRNSTGITGAQWHRYNNVATTSSSIYTAGVFTSTGTAFANTGQGCTPMMLGTPVNPNGKFFLVIGDSISNGANDSTSPAEFGYGSISRAASNNNVNPYPCLNLARATQGSDMFALPLWRQFIKYCNIAFEGYGVNDHLAATPFATFTANVEAGYAILRANGIKKIIRNRLSPYTTSTDGFISEANQTVRAGWGTPTTGYMDMAAAWVASKLGTVIDYYNQRLTWFGTNTYKYPVPSTLNTITASQTGNTLTVTAISGTGTLKIGSPVVLTGGVVGQITALGTGNGGNGTYTMSNSQTVASTSGYANQATFDGVHPAADLHTSDVADTRATMDAIGLPLSLTLPAAFTARWRPSFNIFENGKTYSTDFDITALKPTGITKWVAKTGDDTTGNGTQALPYRTVTKAYTENADVIMIKAGIYDRGDLTTSLNPTRSLALVSADGAGKAVLSRIQAGALAWTQQAGPNNDVYLCTTSIASVRAILDLTYAFAGEYLMDGVTPLPKPYTSVASVAACQALAGSYYLTGSSLYVHTHDNRVPDTNVKVLRVEANLQPATANTTIYFEGMEMWGDDGVRFIVTTASSSSILCGINSASRYGGVALANGWRANGINYAYAVNCETTDYLGNGDGFNYHGDSGNNVSPRFLEVDCRSRRIGISTQSNNNCTTSHEDAVGIRLNGEYKESWGPVSADVKAVGTLGAMTINLGGTYKDCLLTSGTGQDAAIQAGDASVYVKNCTLSGANYALYGATPGTVYNMGGNVDTTTLGNGGVIVAYP